MSAEIIKEGDRIRVVIEGPAFNMYGARTASEVAEGFVSDGAVGLCDEDTVTVEWIEPPVVTFKPGDVVRSKSPSARAYLILEDGWASVGEWRQGVTGVAVRDSKRRFTSAEYELVEIG